MLRVLVVPERPFRSRLGERTCAAAGRPPRGAGCGRRAASLATRKSCREARQARRATLRPGARDQGSRCARDALGSTVHLIATYAVS